MSTFITFNKSVLNMNLELVPLHDLGAVVKIEAGRSYKVVQRCFLGTA